MFKRTNAAYYSIAARVETELGSPAAILLTSALESDGTSMVASRLADALVAAGYRVAAIDVRQDVDRMSQPGKTVAHTDDTTAKAGRTYASLAIRDLGDSFAGSRRDVAALVSRLRVRYDYVIVDAPAFTNGALPTLFADVCDGVIVTVARGRSATSIDRDLNAFLDAATKHTIGIVATTRATIAEFEQIEAARPARRSVPLAEVVDERSSRVSVVAGSV